MRNLERLILSGLTCEWVVGGWEKIGENRKEKGNKIKSLGTTKASLLAAGSTLASTRESVYLCIVQNC